MALSDIIADARQLIQQPDANNSNFTDAQLTIWANEFYRRVCAKLESVPISSRTYTLSTPVTLNSASLTINQAKAYIRPANKWVQLKIIDLEDLINIDPDWEDADTGEPEYLVRSGTFAAILYPAPNSANAGKLTSLKTFGLEFQSLSATTDVPDLPQNIQDLFSTYIAYKAFMRLGDKEAGVQKLIEVNSALKEMRDISTKLSNNRGWKWHAPDAG